MDAGFPRRGGGGVEYWFVSNETNTDVRMYIDEFILDDMDALLYTDELKLNMNCSGNTLAFIQVQQWMRKNEKVS